MGERARDEQQHENRPPPQPMVPVSDGAASVAWATQLQQSAGNAAVARLLTASGRTLGRQPPTTSSSGTAVFANTDLQKIYDENAATGHMGQETALKLLDRSLSGPWEKLDWASVAKSTAERVYKPHLISQKTLGVCGPAAALNASAGADPHAYVKLVIEIFSTGQAMGTKVNKDLLANTVAPGSDPGDWMVLSAMQDASNTFLDYEGRGGGFDEGGTSGDMKGLLEKFSGAVKTTEYSCGFWGVYDEAMKASNLISKHGNDVIVVMGVVSKKINNEDADGSNDHWVRLMSPIAWNDVEVKCDIFTWGSIRSLKMKPKNFEKMVDTFVIGARKQEVAI